VPQDVPGRNVIREISHGCRSHSSAGTARLRNGHRFPARQVAVIPGRRVINGDKSFAVLDGDSLLGCGAVDRPVQVRSPQRLAGFQVA
jgi:hypothetical protein